MTLVTAHTEHQIAFQGNKIFDVGIVGGGLAGLSLSILCAKAGHSVIVAEKEKYPFHKVCGEYISFESWDFIEELGVSLSKIDVPVIRRLIVSAPNGKYIEQTLPMGGFGVSRYKLDELLVSIARKNGVIVLENTKAENINFEKEIFNIRCPSFTIRCKTAAGTFGKRSNIDVLWKRKFTLAKNKKLGNYVGVKYHIKANWPDDLIGLHNFKNGYCGISRIEDQKYCLCYLTSAKNLEQSGNSIVRMEKEILSKNPHLKKIFTEAQLLFDTPVTISQISFAKKNQVEGHVLMTGDAAGMIAPLCGNGMSMAMHGSKIAYGVIHAFLEGRLSRKEMEQHYKRQWRKKFNRRLRTGRFIQRFFGNVVLSDLLIFFLKPFPGLVNKLISSTHGQPF
ncbi:MAG TPA: NAD(P)/FAD-dependent oxidoreductase [Chitinophagaceae bacterium]|nr:NAD(P)/FAD-dependent oxidoreductase [Chitinophagaceae bacterium]